MILLISAARNAVDCVAVARKSLGEELELVATLSQGTAKLRNGDYHAVVVDQVFVDMSPAAAEALWKDAGTATPVFINFAISGVDRIVRELRAALARRQKEQLVAARAAEASLRSELTGAVSGILLSSELALAQPSLPSNIADKLRSVHELALQIKCRLGSVA